MGEGDGVSDVSREEAERHGHSTAWLHTSPLHRYINGKLDVAMYMLGRALDGTLLRADPSEETVADEMRDLEEARGEALRTEKKEQAGRMS